MQRIAYLLVFCLFSFLASGQSRVTQGEYYWDTDPGQGNAFPLLALDGDFDKAVEELFKYGASTGNLTQGPHSLRIRFKGQDGSWSADYKYTVYMQQYANSRNARIVQGEYYWDTDPGQGNGISLLATDGNFNSVIENLTKNVDASTLSLGAHSLAVRTKGLDGQWSAVFRQTVYIECVTPSAPSISIAVVGDLCTSSIPTFEASTVNGGTAPTYQWKVNGINVGANSSTYSDATLVNGDIVTCELTSNSICASTPNATSNSLVVALSAPLIPTVSIGISTTDTLCFGSLLTFTATATNEGISPTYIWQINGLNTPFTGPTLNIGTLLNSDVVSCQLISSAACASPMAVTSSGITVNVKNKLNPSITIAASATTICTGTNITFTATTVDEGTSPTYQWKVNGVNVGTNSNTFSSSTLVNGDDVTCVLTISETCVNASTATSNVLSITVPAALAPGLTITKSPAGSFCLGTNVLFTAGPSSIGASPSYQWYLNGSPVGGDSMTYAFNGFVTGDIVNCTVTSSSLCESGIVATSNNLVMTVNNPVTPSVSIATATTTVCAGYSTLFTATPTNGGSPVYQWKVNGSNVGTNSNTYSSTTLINGDIVSCEMTTSLTCVTATSATSNSLTMTVTPSVPASVSIAASPGSSVCAGTSVTFTATPTNGGVTPGYQWQVNGSNVGTNSDTYSATLSNGNTVRCYMTSTATCPTPVTSLSNVITMTVTANVTPSVTIARSPSTSTICEGTNVTFTATPTNGGATPGYQWYLNGSPVGTNGNTYSNNTLATGNTINCVLTSSIVCVTSPTATSNTFTYTVNAPVTPAVSVSASATTICAGTNVTFTATPTNGGTPTYQWYRNGSPVGTNSATYSSAALTDSDVITCTMTTSLTCVTASSATSNPVTMTVNPISVTSVSIAANPGSSICAGSSVTFTATPTNGGTPAYQWQVNGSNVGTNSDTYTTSALANGNTVRCYMTSTASCPSPVTSLSNVVTMTVTANVTPSIAISRNPGGTICEGTNITFTATPTNGGAIPAYQWYLNGSPVGTNSNTYSNNALLSGNTVNCVLTSSIVCVTSPTATSNTFTITSVAPVTPAVSVSASATTICTGTNVTFTATPTNGGTPTYQWFLNGSPVGTNSATYSSAALSNGDVVSCTMTTSLTCVTASSATSSGITMTVNPIDNTSVGIAANPGSSICAGSSVTFTATPTNGGTPGYQWQVNGLNVGTNSDTYTSASLANGNTVRCYMTSTATCPSPVTSLSNVLTMTVTTNVTPSVVISANPGNSTCTGSNVTFSATPTNGGATPDYQWYLNGSPVGTNSDTYTNNSLVTGNTISCVLTSSIVCVTSPTATSNTVTMTVTTPVTPAVSISASATSICAGTNVTFTATPTNGGTPTYQWYLNGSPVGTNSAIYSSTTLANGDAVTCVLTSSVGCVTSSTATSNSITMVVNSSLPASVSISSSAGSTICTGTSVTFTATPTNGGAPTYQWFLNGSPVGTNSTTYTNATLSHGNVISCQMTSTISCAIPATSTSNSITMTVNAIVTPAVTVSPNTGTTVCGGTNVTFTATPTNGGATPGYQWYLNGSPAGTNSDTYSNSTLTDGNTVNCVLTSSLMCLTMPTGTSNTVTMTVTTPLTPSVNISASASTICDGTSVTFTATPVNGGTPTYQWYRNGSPVGTNSNTYSSSSLNNGDVITCSITSSLSCVTSSTASSNSITMTVNPLISSSVSISSSTGSTSCSGSNVIFTATPVNGGATPGYIWYVNGWPEWSGSPYVTSTLTTGDVVTCEMSSSLSCASPSTVSSNSITMTVYSTNPPTASITSNQGAGICTGGTVNFSATGTNIGASPDYQWYLNGSPVGTNSSSYSNSGLVDGNTVNCVITSNALCVPGQTATSNTITINVVPTVTPTISISTTTTNVCSGSSVTFTASTTNGGTPSYQWYRNGSPVGSNSFSYTTSSLNNGDVITCTLSSSLNCVTSSTATSNSITMTVSSSIPASVSIVSSTGSTSCFGSSVVFTATPTNGGSSPGYQWYVNGSPVGSNSTTYATSTLTTGDIVSCQLSSSISCASPSVASSNNITMTIYSTNAPTASITSDQGAGICAGETVNFSVTGVNIGTSPGYQWYLNGSPVGSNSVSYSNSSLVDGNNVYCVVTSNAPCVSGQLATSNTITINVLSPVTPTVSISASVTTICSGTAVTLTASSTNGGTPSYQWYRNGSPVGPNSFSYTTSSLNNGDVITCTLSSSLGCVTSSSANSNPITITVNPTAFTSVSITSSAGSTSCAGQSVTFTATPTNGGGSPGYQWYVNGSPVGTNSSTYITTTLVNGSTVSCEMTSSLNCPSPATTNSNVITMTVNGNVTPTVSITSNPGSSICGGTTVTFTASATNGGASPTYQWYLNGSPVGTNSTTYSNSSLANGDNINCVVTSSTPCVTGPTASSNVITMNVTTPVAPSVSISASATTICPGTTITFTATPTNGGGSPDYQWTVNGSNVGANSTTYSSSALNNGDLVTCELTSSISCVTSASVTSNGITITVNPTTISAVSISSSAGSTICSGTSITFTATPTNGGTPVYQWLVNGSPVGTNSDTYVTSTLNNNDVVSCEMASSLPCTAPAVVTSNVISMTVNSTVAPTVSISSNQGSSICAGSTVIFTATPTNGGGSPSYQWQLNGSPVGTNATIYSNSSLANGDVVNCILTSSATCPTTTTAISNSITISVTIPVTPTVSISSSATTICDGTSVTCTATPTNGGTPAYQWFVNGSPVGTNSTTFSSITLNNGDAVTCELTSSLTCVTSATATSNSISMTVNPTVATSVNISSSAGSTICSGTSVTFTATPTNGGTPSYQWLVNGLPVGTNSATYVTSTLNNGEVVTCQMTSSLSCPSPAVANSNGITMTVNSTATPTISISSNVGSSTCIGTNVIFTASTTNGGSSPGYQWMLNGTPVGTNSDSYSNAALITGDVVNCILTSSATCPATTSATSNSITMTISSTIATSVSIVASATSICSGTSVTFTATATNGGTPTYQWQVDGSPVGTNSSTYTSSGFANGQVVTCVMTSSLLCATPVAAISDGITMTVNSTATPTITISSNPFAPTICSGISVTFTANITNGGSSPVYQWKLNGANVGTNSPTYVNATLATGDAVTCQLTSNAVCATVLTVLSNSISKTVTPSVTPTITITSNPVMPVCESVSVTLTATITNGGSNPTYQWKKNGQNWGTNSPTYSPFSWVDGDVYTCVLTSNATCATTNQVTSNGITMDIIEIDETITVNGNTITANQAGATYQWFECTFQTPIIGATQQSYTVTESGLYSVQITIGSCTEDSGCEFIDWNALNELTDAGILLYPNPTANYFVIELPNNAVNMTMTLFDVSGRKVQEGMLSGMHHQIDVNHLATGSYQIILTDGNTQYVGKVIVNRQ